MKALSLWQPYASAIVLGSKSIETRSWATTGRGLLAIHAGRKRDDFLANLVRQHDSFKGALLPVLTTAGFDALPFGAVVGVVELIDCRPVEDFPAEVLDRRLSRVCPLRGPLKWTERTIGDYTPGRFGWVFDKPVWFRHAVPCVGHQRVFNLDRSATIRVEQLRTAVLTGDETAGSRMVAMSSPSAWGMAKC